VNLSGDNIEVNLSGDNVERTLYCVNELVARRYRAGEPVPRWMIDLGRQFDMASLSMSPRGHESERAAAELDPERLIGTTEAATILGVSPRQVRRIANDLDVETIGRRGKAFRHSTVAQYAEERRGRHTGGIRAVPPQPQ
jgi:hypothetical protein